MIEIKDIMAAETRDVMKRVADDVKNCMCCTDAKEVKVKTRTKGTSWVDDEGNFWFLSKKSDHADTNIAPGSHIELIYSEPGQAHLLTVYGTGTICNFRERTRQNLQLLNKEWFLQDVPYSDILLIKVIPVEAYYKDDRFGHMVALLNMEHRKAA